MFTVRSKSCNPITLTVAINGVPTSIEVDILSGHPDNISEDSTAGRSVWSGTLWPQIEVLQWPGHIGLLRTAACCGYLWARTEWVVCAGGWSAGSRLTRERLDGCTEVDFLNGWGAYSGGKEVTTRGTCKVFLYIHGGVGVPKRDESKTKCWPKCYSQIFQSTPSPTST